MIPRARRICLFSRSDWFSEPMNGRHRRRLTRTKSPRWLCSWSLLDLDSGHKAHHGITEGTRISTLEMPRLSILTDLQRAVWSLRRCDVDSRCNIDTHRQMQTAQSVNINEWLVSCTLSHPVLVKMPNHYSAIGLVISETRAKYDRKYYRKIHM